MTDSRTKALYRVVPLGPLQTADGGHLVTYSITDTVDCTAWWRGAPLLTADGGHEVTDSRTKSL